MDLAIYEVKLKEEFIFDDICEDDDLEELIYTIIDACPYDFQSIPTIASFKYLSFYDKITQYNGVRYFFKMYKLIDMLCFYKELINNMEAILSNCSATVSSNKAIALLCKEEELFESCQIEAIKIYKENSFLEIDDLKLAFCLNCIINEFFEEAFTSKLKKKDITSEVKRRTNYEGIDIFEFI